MRLVLERFGFGRDSTLGEMSIDGKHVCFTIEDERRYLKVKGETCIPVGIYDVKLRTDSPKFASYGQRFPALHRGMLWLQHVPGFEYVYIHCGNTDNESEGCILPNVRPAISPTGEFGGTDSASAYVAVYKRALAAFDAGDVVIVEIRERQAA